ncbi:MAG: glycosyltransferase family 4 protein [Collinsella sp.]|nr:glycosyltransferase family 4 protein [Collinsella sp.]
MRSRYVLFSALYPPHMGGIENFTYSLAHALVERGNEVLVVTNDTNGLGAGITDEDGVGVLRLPCLPFFAGRFPVPKINAVSRKLWKRIECQQFDGVLVNARFYIHSLDGIRFAKSLGITPVVLDHGSAFLSFSNPAIDPLVRTYERLITTLGKRLHPDYYGVSSKSVEWLRSFGIAAKGVIPNSIDAKSFREKASGRDFRSELSVGAESFLVCFVGRLIPEKGINAILEASKSHRLVEAGVVFVLAGDGALSKEVDDAQGESLRWVGRLSSSDISALLQQSDLLCLPTRSEGFATTLLEASACGCPSVVTDVGGARELFPNEHFGTIIDSMDSDAVEQAIYSLVKNPDKLAEQSRLCRRMIENESSWDKTASIVEKVLSGTKR